MKRTLERFLIAISVVGGYGLMAAGFIAVVLLLGTRKEFRNGVAEVWKQVSRNI